MIVDTHVHIISADRMKHPLASGATGWSTEGVLNPIEDLLREMDSAGVDRATLVQPVGPYAFDNSYHADSAASYPKRTVGVGYLDPTAADSADKLSYWVKDRGMKGIRLNSGQADINDPRAFPLWERAQALKVPLSIGGGGRPDRIDQMRAMAAKFPSVIMAPDHMAGWSAAKEQRTQMTDALVNLAKQPNAYLRISTTSFQPYADLTEPEKTQFRKVIDAFTPKKVMWGSNYPANRVGGYKAQVEIGKTAVPFLAAEDRRWILGETALTVWPMLR